MVPGRSGRWQWGHVDHLGSSGPGAGGSEGVGVADGCPGLLRAESREKKPFQVPGSTAVKNGPLDSDFQSILETPLDFPGEGDALRGKNAGQSVGLPPPACSLSICHSGGLVCGPRARASQPHGSPGPVRKQKQTFCHRAGETWGALRGWAGALAALERLTGRDSF